MRVVQMDVKVTAIREVNLEKANELLKEGDWIVLGYKVDTEFEAEPNMDGTNYNPVTSITYSLGKLEPRIAKFA